MEQSEKQRLDSLSRLSGRIAHDVNNVLGVIVNYATFVIEEAESPEPDLAMLVADAKQVLKASERGTDLTRRLLAFARRGVAQPQELDLNKVVAEAEEALRRAAGEQVTLLVRPDPDLPPISGDPAALEELLVLLAANAGEAMPSGGNLVIETGRQDDRVLLRVCDCGRGMTPEVLGQAFEPFFTTKTAGGHGLGLPIAYGIVRQAGGELTVTSEPGLGTTVTVLLPTG